MDFRTTLGPLIFGEDVRPLHDYLRNDGLIKQNITCQHCQFPMQTRARPNNKADGISWRCINNRCPQKWTWKSIRTGSFFQDSKVALSTWLHCLFLWCIETSVRDTSLQLQLSNRTVLDMFKSIRTICSRKLQQHPIRLGGPGVTVQIDESCFRHKPKYHRGRPPQRVQWVFGIADTSTSPAIGFLQMEDRRDAATLLPIIQNVLLPGTTVHSDQWRAYNNVGLHFTHRTVNHSLHFVDPVTGVHTQTIESYWAKCKKRLKNMHGTTLDMLPGYLDEFMWRDRYGQTVLQCFDNIKSHIAELYPL